MPAGEPHLGGEAHRSIHTLALGARAERQGVPSRLILPERPPGSSGRERGEDVVVIGRGLVVLRVAPSEVVEVRSAAEGEVQPAALAEPGGAADAGCPADGLVVGDRADEDCERGSGVVVAAATEAIATAGARAPGAADCLVAGDRAVAGGQGPPKNVGEPAPHPAPAVAAGAALAADGPVVLDPAIADRGRVAAPDHEPA